MQAAVAAAVQLAVLAVQAAVAQELVAQVMERLEELILVQAAAVQVVQAQVQAQQAVQV
jgi:hypothetical protein